MKNYTITKTVEHYTQTASGKGFKSKPDGDYEYINCGIRQKVKYNRIWEFDEVQNDWYSFTGHIYMSEYERINGIN